MISKLNNFLVLYGAQPNTVELAKKQAVFASQTFVTVNKNIFLAPIISVSSEYDSSSNIYTIIKENKAIPPFVLVGLLVSQVNFLPLNTDQNNHLGLVFQSLLGNSETGGVLPLLNYQKQHALTSIIKILMSRFNVHTSLITNILHFKVMNDDN